MLASQDRALKLRNPTETWQFLRTIKENREVTLILIFYSQDDAISVLEQKAYQDFGIEKP